MLSVSSATGNQPTPRTVKKTERRKVASNKMKKAPDAPKRFKSAFIFFSIQKHKEIRAQLGDKGHTARTANISKIVAEAWKVLSPVEVEKWEAMAENDRVRYEAEKMMFKGSWYVPKQRKTKDVNAPKRPMSAFLAFANSRRGAVKKGMPGASNGDVSRALATLWKEAQDDIRQGYIEEEQKQRQEYMIAMSEWRKENDEKERAERQQREDKAVDFAELVQGDDGHCQGTSAMKQLSHPENADHIMSPEMTPPSWNYSLFEMCPNYSSMEVPERSIPIAQWGAPTCEGQQASNRVDGKLCCFDTGHQHSLATLLNNNFTILTPQSSWLHHFANPQQGNFSEYATSHRFPPSAQAESSADPMIFPYHLPDNFAQCRPPSQSICVTQHHDPSEYLFSSSSASHENQHNSRYVTTDNLRNSHVHSMSPSFSESTFAKGKGCFCSPDEPREMF